MRFFLSTLKFIYNIEASVSLFRYSYMQTGITVMDNKQTTPPSSPSHPTKLEAKT